MSIKLLDTVVPAGSFKVVDAEDVAYSTNSVADTLDDLLVSVNNITQILTGIPTFTVTGIPTTAVTPNEEIKVNLFVKSENAAECRVLIRKQKMGVNQIQTSSATCYPGQEYPITLDTPKELGVFKYTISVTNGAKRCGLAGTTDGADADIQYEYTFEIVCGTANLLLPIFERDNASKIYSFNLSNEFNLDFNYTVAQPFKSYKFKAEMFKNGTELVCDPLEESFTEATEVNPGTTIRKQLKYPFNVSAPESTSEYTLIITALAIDSAGTVIDTSVVSRTFAIDLMVNNSITHTIAPLKSDLTSNDFLTVSFTPKTNNTNYNTSVIKYICELYRKVGDNVESTPIKSIPINAYNLQKSTVSFDKFITLDTTLSELDIGTTRKYRLRLQCIDSAIANRQQTDMEITIEKVPDLSSEFVKSGLVLSFDFSKNLAGTDGTVANNFTENLPQNTSYTLNLINTTVDGVRESGEIITSDKRLTGETPIEERATYFTFKSGQGAVLVDHTNQPIDPSKTFYTDTVANPDFIPGYSFEIMFKSTYLGDYSAVTASFGNDATDVEATDGVSIPVGKCRTYNNGESTEASIRRGVWKHVVFVVERSPAIRYKIYINGILSAVKAFTGENSPSDSTPLAINGIFALDRDTMQNTLQKSGTTSIKFIRYYNRALTNDDIFQNFKTIYTKEEYKKVIDKRNNSASSVNVFFIKNSHENQIRNRPENKVKGYVSFAELNVITKKKPEDENDQSHTSKTHAVNGTMLYTYTNEFNELVIKKYTNVDILLQGTSSLKYPVKNYQIKVYSEKPEEQYAQLGKDSKKLAVYPPTKDASTWTTPSYIYTLKCDYMEESHRNNTPTACYYQDRVLDAVIEYCAGSEYYRTNICDTASAEQAAAINANDVLFKDNTGMYSAYSPAKRHAEISGDGSVIYPYRDAIDGSPCIVYYSDIPLTKEISNANDVMDLVVSSTCAGSFMFNVDKEGPQLGFELPADDIQGSVNISRNDCLVDDKVRVDSSGKISPSGQLLLKSLPCISYEGATNDNFSAAAFMPYAVQRANYLKYAWNAAPEAILTVNGITKVYKYFNLRTVEVNSRGEYIYELNDSGATKPDTSCVIYFESTDGFGDETKDLDVITVETAMAPATSEAKFEGQMAYYTAPVLSNSCAWKFNGTDWETKTDLLSLINGEQQNQRICTMSFLAFIASFYHDRLPATLDNDITRAIHGCNTYAEHSDTYGKNEIDYIAKTLEPRFTFADDVEEVDLESTGYNTDDLSYTTIKNAIDWAYSCFVLLNGDEAAKAQGKAKFRNEFTRYFSFEYCLTYFLQMMLFTQVDNAGKNAMFDTWGNGKLYPRPYDMDTQMGLNNSGTDRIPVSAELNPVFSPQRGGTAVRNSMWATSSDAGHIRFLSYNTTNSALWKTFALSFEREIRDCYSYLRRNSIYNAEVIQDYINSKTRDVIGETYYNQDAFNKYMYDPNNTAYYYCVNGSREDRYFEFLSNRITFLDSYFDFTSTDNGVAQNNTIMLRALPLEIGDYLILKPLSPMYVSVTAEPNTTTCLITPEDTYEDDNGDIQFGSKFTFQMEATDKNMYITGSNNISNITGLETLDISEIQLNNAKNITDLAVTDADALTSLTLVGNSNLKTLDLSGNRALKVMLDLHDCANLKSVNISNSGITSLVLPDNCDLTYLNCENCAGLKALSLKNMLNLTNNNLILTGCRGLTTLEIDNCPQIVSTDAIPFIKDTFDLQDNDKTLPALQRLTIKNCPSFSKLTLLQRSLYKLEFDFAERGLVDLDLSGCYGNAFHLLELNNCPALTAVNLSGVYSNDALSDINQVRLRANHTYSSVDMSHSQINVVYTNSVIENTMNFDTVKFGKLILNYNTRVTAIAGLSYTGDLRAMFRECKSLVTLEASHRQGESLSADTDTSINGLFELCEKLENVSGNINFSKATSANSACRYCYKLTQASLQRIIDAFGVDPVVGSMDYFAHEALSECKELNVKLPSSVTSLYRAFYGSDGIEIVGESLLQGCTALTSVAAMFGACKALKFVHKDLFKDCHNLLSAKECFRDCSSLGMEVDITEMSPVDQERYGAGNNIMYNSLDIFPSENKIQDISFIFHNCTSLTNNQGVGDGYGRTAETSADDEIFANKFFAKLTNLQKAICAFHNTPNLRLYFKEYIFSFDTIQLELTHIDGLFAYSGLLNIPAQLTRYMLPNLKNARGVFSNILPEGDGDSDLREERFTRITVDFFNGATAIQHISDSATVAGDTTFQHSGAVIPKFGGIFANIPNLLIETGCFSKLNNLLSVDRALFTGSVADTDAASYDKYRNRSVVHPNKLPSSNSGATGKLISYYPRVVEKGTNTEVLIEIDLFNHGFTSIQTAAYLFAGNPVIQSVSSYFADCLVNATNISGIFSNCLALTCEVADGSNNLLKITSNKSKLKNASLAFENCHMLNTSIVDADGNTILTGTATDNSVTTFNCRGMFYGSGITGTVPANLFEDCRTKVTNVSYMFAKCYKLTNIAMGYATDYNIPYVYDGSDVTYYYDRNKDALGAYPDYNSFKAAMDTYFTDDIRDNWFGCGKQFDRYRNYLEQWFYTQSRYYPDGLLYDDFAAANKIITINTYDELEYLVTGRYYITAITHEGLWKKDADGTISQITSSADTRRVYLLNNNNELVSITSIADSGEPVTIDQFANGGYRPVGTQNTVLLSKYGYYDANNKYTIVQPGLLSDCTKLSNVVYMFAGCFGLTGCIPADMFAYTSNYKGITSIEGLFAGCANLTLNAVPSFDDSRVGMILSFADSGRYNTTVYNNITEESGFKTLSEGGYYSKVYPTVIYTKEDDQYRNFVVDDEFEDNGNYFVPKDWLAKLTALSNIRNAFHSVGIASDLRVDSIGRIIKPETRALGRPSRSDTSGFNKDSFIYAYLKLDNITFNSTELITDAYSAFANVSTLGGTELTKDFLSASKGNLKNISNIFRTATLRQVNKPFQGTIYLTNVKDCFYGVNTNYNLSVDSYGGPRENILFKTPEDNKKPLSWMSGGILVGSIGPELWRYSKIMTAEKNNCLASLTPVVDKDTWFAFRKEDPGTSYLFNPNSISNPDNFRQ